MLELLGIIAILYIAIRYAPELIKFAIKLAMIVVAFCVCTWFIVNCLLAAWPMLL